MCTSHLKVFGARLLGACALLAVSVSVPTGVSPVVAEQAVSKERLEESVGKILTVGSAVAAEDGTGSVQFELNKEIAPDTALNRLRAEIKLTAGVQPGAVTVLPSGFAQVQFKGAAAGTKVEAFLPDGVASQLIAEEEKQEQQAKETKEEKMGVTDKAIGTQPPTE